MIEDGSGSISMYTRTNLSISAQLRELLGCGGLVELVGVVGLLVVLGGASQA